MKYVSMLVAVMLLAVCASNADAACRCRPHLLSRTVHVVRSAVCSCATKCTNSCGAKSESKTIVKRERTVVRGTCNGNSCTK